VPRLRRPRRRSASTHHTPVRETFARGERSVADLTAPTAIEEGRGALTVDGTVSRVLALTDYPRHVTPNWLGRLIDFDEAFDLSLHLEPLDSGEVVRALTHRMVELQSSRMLDARGGRIASVEREVAYEDVERLRDALERGDERVFSTAVYLRLHGRSPAAVEQATARLEGVLAGMMAGVRPALYEMLPGTLSCLPAGQDHLRRRRNLDTSSAATMIPFGSSHLAMARGLLYGENIHNHSLVIADPFGSELENANKVVFAKSGAGKSYACKVEALRAMLLGIDYLVIDPEDEYGRICEAVGGQLIRLAGASAHRINPFDLPPAGDDEGRDPLAQRVLALQGLLGVMLADPGRSLGQQERGVLDQAIYETYRRTGITEEPATHHRPAPVLRDLLAVLGETAEPHGLASRLARYVDGSLGHVFAERTTASLDRPFVCFNVRDLEEELRPVAMYLIADHVWREVTRDPRPRMLLIDEAWTLMRHEEGAKFLSQMARRARKRWLGVTTVTQDVEDFLHSPEGHTVLANSSVQLLMRQDSSTIGIVEETFGLSRGEREYLLGCRRGEGLLLARGNHIALRIEASQLEDALSTTNPAELAREQLSEPEDTGQRGNPRRGVRRKAVS
jgi:conjugal transfer ATP-binding protein TraC